MLILLKDAKMARLKPSNKLWPFPKPPNTYKLWPFAKPPNTANLFSKKEFLLKIVFFLFSFLFSAHSFFHSFLFSTRSHFCFLSTLFFSTFCFFYFPILNNFVFAPLLLYYWNTLHIFANTYLSHINKNTALKFITWQ